MIEAVVEGVVGRQCVLVHSHTCLASRVSASGSPETGRPLLAIA